MRDLGHVALGSWSGGHFMFFGEPVPEDRLLEILRPGDGIDTVVTADAYGAGKADELLGRALAGVPREDYTLVGCVGHDFYEGRRQGAKGFPRFTDPALRGEDGYADYLRMATERSLERLGVDHFDLLLLHNPDHTGYRSPAVWAGMAALKETGLTGGLGIAPGPANGFTLDVLACLEAHGELVDWAMLILNPFEPWPGQLVLDACEQHDVSVLARVVDFGGIFWDDVLPGHVFVDRDHRTFRPAGWVEAGREKLERLRPIAERHGLTMLQLACQWDLAHGPVRSVVPTLIQEPAGSPGRPEPRTIESKRAELAATPREVVLSSEELEEIRAVGDNTGCMALKGASPEHDGDPLPDRWAVGAEDAAVGGRWGIDPERDLRQVAAH